MKTAIKTYTICFFLLLMQHLAHAQSNEYLLKAGFIGKFASFTQWPVDTNSETFHIIILGDSPFNNTLEELYKNKLINHKKVKISYTNSIENITNCQILFICSSEKHHTNEILDKMKNLSTLTISESKGMAHKGVHINFYQTNSGTIHFEMNGKKIKQAGLKMDAMLLNYAKLIDG